MKTHLKDRYTQFEQKCTRKVTINGRSVELLIEKIKNSDAILMSQYVNPELRLNIFNKQNLRKIESLLREYNLIVTKLLIININRLNERINQQNLPNDLKKLQCLFMESLSIAIYAINDIVSTSNGNTAGSDSVSFKSKAEFLNNIQEERLIRTKYFFSAKSAKIKKDLPKVIKDNIVRDSKLAEQRAAEYNLKLQLKLIKKVNLRSIFENYKPINNKRMWVRKINSETIAVSLPSLRDRIIQKIMIFAILPIAKFQKDSNYFGLGKNRSIHQAISTVANSFMRFSRINQPMRRSKCEKTAGCEFTVENGNRNELRENGKQSQKLYCVFSSTAKKNNIRRYIPYTKYLSITIVDYFDNISHEAILKLTPVITKYLFLLKAWLKVPVVGPESVISREITCFRPLCGVPRGSIIGKLACNIALDGLEQTLYKICLKNSHYSLNIKQQKFAKQKIGIKDLIIQRETDISYI